MDHRLDSLKRSLESAVEGMSSEQWNWHAPDKWCAAEILEQLYLTYTGTIKGFERVLVGGRSLASRASVTQRLRTFVVMGFGHIPTGLEAPTMVRPQGLPREKGRKEFETKMAAMDAIITQCEARFGRGVYLLDHPILDPLTGTQWRKLHLVHGWHHQKQLLRLREAPNGS